jgi:hypothetical protein
MKTTRNVLGNRELKDKCSVMLLSFEITYRLDFVYILKTAENGKTVSETHSIPEELLSSFVFLNNRR